MIVSACGFGSSGSSVVCDYLLECENVQSFDAFEFNLTTMEDGIEDLEYHLMKNYTKFVSGMNAIQRFRKAISHYSRYWSMRTGMSSHEIYAKSEAYLDSIIQQKFIGDTTITDSGGFFKRYVGISIIKQRLILFLERNGYLKKNINFYPLGNVEVCISPSNFYDASRKFVKDMLSSMGCDLNKIIVLDQAFAGNNPAKSFPFFEDPYAIVVDRDPRDQYIFAKKKLLSRGRFMPTENVYEFIKYYRLLRDNQEYKNENSRVLNIQFEELIYDYDKATRKIDNFLHVINVRPKTVFDPAVSVVNTNLVTKFPEFLKDVKIIEKELPEYLFPFENYKSIKNDGEMFIGKSPLNLQK